MTTISSSDTGWVPLEAAVRILNSKKPERGEEYENSYSSRWLTQAGLMGVRFKGKPVMHWDGSPMGDFQAIPRTYFLRSRAFYGSVGIAAIAWGFIGPRDEKAIEAGCDDPQLLLQEEHHAAFEKGVADPDWEDVFLSRADFQRYFGFDVHSEGQEIQSGPDGWLDFPPEPTPNQRAIYPIHKLAVMEMPLKKIPASLSMPQSMTRKLAERWDTVKEWDEIKRIQAGISPEFRGVSYASVKRWLAGAGR